LAGLGSGGLVAGLLHGLHDQVSQVSPSSFLFFFFSISFLLFVV
jgi:hypothetical protein